MARLLGILLLVAASVVGCGTFAGPDAEPAAVALSGADGEERTLTRSGSLALRVDGVDAAADEAQQIIEQTGGRVARLEARSEKRVEIHARVPADRLAEAMDRLAGLGEQTHRTLEVRDVTEEFIDLEAQLANLSALRDRLRALLDRASEVGEVLEIERELTRVQTELDSLEGRLKRLRLQVELSSLALDFSEAEPKRILGPLGYAVYGASWVVEKLFVIRRGTS